MEPWSLLWQAGFGRRPGHHPVRRGPNDRTTFAAAAHGQKGKNGSPVGGRVGGPDARASAGDPGEAGLPRPLRPDAPRDALVGLLVVQVFFGALPVAGHLAFAGFPPLALAALRLGGAALVMGVVHTVWFPERVAKRHLLPLAVFALFGIVGNQVLFMLGLARTDPVAASVLVTTIPAFTLFVAVLLRVERPGPRKIAGIAFAFAGVVVLVGVTPTAFRAGNALGNTLVALNALSYAIYLVIARNMVRVYRPLTVAVWTFVFGAFVILPLGTWDLVHMAWGDVSASAWWSLAFIIAFPTVGAYLINNWALGRVPPSTVAVFIYLQPIVAALSAYWFFGTVPGPRTVAGAALIFAGVWAAAVSRTRLRTFGRARV